MRPELIWLALRDQGYSYASLARELGYTINAVRSIVYSQKKSQKVESKISEITGIPLSELWPDRYSDVAA
ncbi:MAG: transcriptional regulator [Acaryochloridaceae cyanobacterium CSU_3_4]|nr:transcriptional regulator [Acaryochloridaceae cyanobacterium CSU_3_4]